MASQLPRCAIVFSSATPKHGILSQVRRLQGKSAAEFKDSKKLEKDGMKLSKDGREADRQFWMPDPATGYFIPQNHFGDVDVALLRDSLLTKNYSPTS